MCCLLFFYENIKLEDGIRLKPKRVREVFRAMLLLFSGWSLLFRLVIFSLIYGAYLYISTRMLILSLVVGLIFAVPSLYYISYRNKKMKREIALLKDLNTYATTMTFFLQSGKNLRAALEATRPSLSERLQNDIDRVLKSLDEDSLSPDMSVFDKYKFSPIKAFNDVLIISRDEGGDKSTMFNRVNENINFAITKHDEMVRGKKIVAKQIYFIIGAMLSIPVMLSCLSTFLSTQMYDQFLFYPISIVGVIIFFAVMITWLFKHEKKKTDTSMFI